MYNQPVAGIPIDSEYVIFIVDTSGSMQSQNWRYAEEKLGEVLNIYPKLKGIQVMDDEGGYMFSEYRGKWIPDSPARRKAILDRFRKWQAFSNSSPSEGIIAAVRTFWTREHPISIYVFGDEFTGPSIQEVVDTVDRINRVGRHGRAAGPHPFARVPDSQPVPPAHEHALRDADAHTVGPERRGVRRTAGRQQHRIATEQLMRQASIRPAVAALCLVLLSGCTATRLETQAQLPPPLIEQLPVRVGIYYSKEFREYVHRETRGNDRLRDQSRARTRDESRLAAECDVC